uniref:Bm4553, isoform f n=2 Tax=Brugia TaxID=6278 RepID=A0A1I9G3Q9_BRUMA|nr:Bm4553, isoform f [Brugia malayi]
MYRVCARFLGKNFVWTILEQARFDLLTRNETYLLKPRMSYIASDEYDSCCSADLTDDEQNSCDSHVFATVPSSDHLRRTRQLCIGSVKSLRKQSKIISEHWKYSASIASQSSSNAEFTSSEKSASLHLLWDDPQWDEATDFCFYGAAVQHDQYSASSDVSNMTEFQAAKGLFEEPDNRCKVNEEDQKNSENVTDFLQSDFRCTLSNTSLLVFVNFQSNREEKHTDFDTNDFIQKNCMVDSKHLYQITAGFITRTNSISVSSERSSQSFPSLRRRLIANTPSDGLLELVQPFTTTSVVSSSHMITSMTDSGISRGTISTSNLQSSIRSNGAKGTFGAEILSSEDEAVDTMMPCILTTNRNSLIGRNNLKLISEDRCSTTASTLSMEWFEDDFCPFVTNQNLRGSLNTDMDDPLAACFSGSGSDQMRPNNAGNIRKHLYNVTRDLMAWAKDQFVTKSPQLKALQLLYTSDQRWRRIGLKRSSNCSEQFLSSLLHLMFIHGIPFFGCSDFSIIAKVSLDFISLH